MKNTLKLFGIIAFVFMIGFSSCDNGENGNGKEDGSSTNGELTITGLGGQTGYVYAYYRDYSGGPRMGVLAAGGSGINVKNGTVTGVQITGDQVKLKVWENPETNVFSNYTKTETIDFSVFIRPAAQTENFDLTGKRGKVDANFTNGIGTGVFAPN